MYPYFTSIAVSLTLLLYFILVYNTGRARRKYGVKAPAITGHEMFERTYRVQMNMLEQMVMFLPALGIFSWYVGDRTAMYIGCAWVFARAMYSRAYVKNPDKRHLWWLVSMLLVIVLWVGFTGAVVKLLVFKKFFG